MTQAQHEKLVALRTSGVGFTEISVRLGMSVNTVKSYCRRHGICVKSNDPPLVATDACAHCGRALSAPSRKTQRFCSAACRTGWWNANRDRLHRKTIVQKTCAACGATFAHYPKQNRRFCSHPCYIRHRFSGGAHVDERAV